MFVCLFVCLFICLFCFVLFCFIFFFFVCLFYLAFFLIIIINNITLILAIGNFFFLRHIALQGSVNSVELKQVARGDNSGKKFISEWRLSCCDFSVF